LLEIVSESGQALSTAEASKAAGNDTLAIATLTHMRSERLVRLIGSEEHPLVDTYHDQIRSTVLQQLDVDAARSLHGSLAEVIETNVGCVAEEFAAAIETGNDSRDDSETIIDRVYHLAYHFDAAGANRKAWIYGLLAAEQAHRQSALEVAAEQFAIAKRNSEDTSDSVKFRIARGCGDALTFLGRYDDADMELHNAIDHTDDVLEVAHVEHVEHSLGRLAYMRGSMIERISYFENSLRRLGNWVPKTLGGLAYGLLRESLIQTLHSLFPGRLHKKTPTSKLDLTIHLHHWLSHPQIFRNTLKLLWTQLAGLNRSETVPPTYDLAVNSAAHGMIMSMLGWHGRSPYYIDRSRNIARELDDNWLLGACCSRAGVGYTASARYSDGLEVLNESLRSFEQAGDLYELNVVRFHICCCQYGLGNLAESIAEARSLFASSARISDSRMFCSSYLWARATRGNLPFDELKSCYPHRPDDIMSTVHGMMAEGHWHTFHSRTEEAVEIFERAGELIRKNHCVNSHMIVALPELAAALRRHADSVQSSNPREFEQLRKRSLRLTRWAVRMARFFPATYPQSLRELSLILAKQGKTRQSLKYADKSCAVAEGQQAKRELAQSSVLRARLRHELGRVGAEQQVQQAEAEMEKFERQIAADPPLTV
jgi:eukaryotic-like serine/threonine-protein kinase